MPSFHMIVDNRGLTLRSRTVLRSFAIMINTSTIKEDRAMFCLLQSSAIVNSIRVYVVKSAKTNTNENVFDSSYPLRRCHSGFGPRGPYPLADLDPPSQIWTPHKTFLFPNLF